MEMRNRKSVLAGAILAGAAALVVLPGAASAAVVWGDDFAGATGAGTDAVLIQNHTYNEGYDAQSITPTGSTHSYRSYAGVTPVPAAGTPDGTAWQASFVAKQNAIGSQPGVVFTNVTGFQSTFGGVGQANAVWGTPGTFTETQVADLVFKFDDQATGSYIGGNSGIRVESGSTFSNSDSYFALSGPGASHTLRLGDFANAAKITTFTNELNAGAGLYFQLYLPNLGAPASAGSTIAIANIQIDDPSVPEPASLGLLGLSVVALRRRRH